MYKNITLTATLPYHESYEDEQIVVVCSLLKANGHGTSLQSALKQLRDAVALKIQVWMENGKLPEMLSSYGFQPMLLGGQEYWVASWRMLDDQRFNMKKTRLRIQIQSRAIELGMFFSLPLNFPWYITSDYPLSNINSGTEST